MITYTVRSAKMSCSAEGVATISETGESIPTQTRRMLTARLSSTSRDRLLSTVSPESLAETGLRDSISHCSVAVVVLPHLED